MSPKIILALTSIVSIATALPQIPRAPQECSPGTWFYACSNGYRGCFSYDPCNLPTITASASSTPAPTPTPTQTPRVVAHPQYFNIYQTNQPNHPTDNVPHIDLHTNITRQVVIFTGIPSTATRCSINWRQGDPETRVFRVEDNGLVSSRELKTDGFPTWTPGSDVLINPTTIEPFVGIDEFTAGMDFTFWDQPNQPARTHDGPSVECQERIIIELAVNLNNGNNGRVFMQDDAENGLYIQYS